MLTKAMGRVPRKMNNLFGTYFPFLAFAADLLHRGRMIGGLALWWGLIGLTTHSTPYHALSISAFNLFLSFFKKKNLVGMSIKLAYFDFRMLNMYIDYRVIQRSNGNYFIRYIVIDYYSKSITSEL